MAVIGAPDLGDRPSAPAQLLRVSSLVTYAGILCGSAAAMSAVVLRRADLAGMFMALAVIADVFDGRFARRFPHSPFQSAFGVQIDSLSDALNSGAVPVIALAALTVKGVSAGTIVWWVVGAFYTICAVTRLGYFNLTHDDEWFIGLPTPASSLFVSTALLWSPGLFLSGSVLAACAVAMVAPFRFRRPKGRGLAAFVLWALLLVGLHALA